MFIPEISRDLLMTYDSFYTSFNGQITYFGDDICLVLSSLNADIPSFYFRSIGQNSTELCTFVFMN